MKTAWLLSGAVFIVVAQAQQGAWGQCGGIGWSGQTKCISGYSCVYSNPWYSQCLPGAPPTTANPTTVMPTTTTSSVVGCYLTTMSTKTITSTTSAIISMSSVSSVSSMSASSSTTSSSSIPTGTGFKWMGVDESGAEFGSGAYPGVWGKDFIFPSLTSLDTLMSQGFNIFRLPFSMERMAPGGVSSPLDPAYSSNYSTIVNHITQKGGYAIIDPHNYGRYDGNIITDTTAFQNFWANIASLYANNSHAIFDTNNEYHDEDQNLVFNMNQAAINGIRAAGATTQYIFVEGNSWSGAWTWASVNDNLKGLTDPSNKIVYEMHQYLDSDGSGTSATCVNSTIGVSRITSATQWLNANNKLGVIGEFAGGANPTCMSAVTGMLQYMEANSNVWLGALWWGGGPWWGDYIYGFEPPSSTGYNYYDTTLESFAP